MKDVHDHVGEMLSGFGPDKNPAFEQALRQIKATMGQEFYLHFDSEFGAYQAALFDMAFALGFESGRNPDWLIFKNVPNPEIERLRS